MSVTLHHGDCRAVLATLPADSVDCAVTSPPYYGLRSYLPADHPDKALELGAEQTPEQYIAHMVEVFRQVGRVLKPTGTLWLNLGDTTVKKRLQGIPWRTALALQADGWILRSEIIWHKPNPMPESVRDRPTKAHEHVFLLSKNERYHFDQGAVKEKCSYEDRRGNQRLNYAGKGYTASCSNRNDGDANRFGQSPDGRNIRSVWTITPKPLASAHFATFPPELAERCIKAGCPINGTVLDPFAGAVTTLMVANRLGRSAIGIELSAAYCEIAERRLAADAPLLSERAA